MKELIILSTSIAIISQSIIGGFKLSLRIMGWIYGTEIEQVKNWPKVPEIFTPFFCAPCFAFWTSLIALPAMGGNIITSFTGACFSYITSKLIAKYI